MTSKQIEAKQMKDTVKFAIALQIRKLLDDARKAYGPTDWDDDAVESDIIELVTGEG